MPTNLTQRLEIRNQKCRGGGLLVIAEPAWSPQPLRPETLKQYCNAQTTLLPEARATHLALSCAVFNMIISIINRILRNIHVNILSNIIFYHELCVCYCYFQ